MVSIFLSLREEFASDLDPLWYEDGMVETGGSR